MMKKTTWRMGALLLIGLLGGFFLLKQGSWEQPSSSNIQEITDLSNRYNADVEVQSAEEKLAGGLKGAQVITANEEQTGKIALVIDGLPDRPTTARILDVLQKYNAKAVFFVEGQNAVDQPETIQLIKDGGQEIGNYTFIGIAEADKLSSDDLLRQLCQTQKVLEVQTGTMPRLFRAPRTRYQPSLLQAVEAAGIGYAVKSNAAFPRHKLHSVDDALAFVATLPPGSILSVQGGTSVSSKKYEPGKTDERPAVDKKPTIKDAEVSVVDAGDSLADEIEFLLAALEQQNITTEFVDGFHSIHFIPAQ